MHARKLAVLTMALLMSIAAFSGEKQQMKIEIAVEGDEGKTEFSFDSEDAGFNLHDLAVGEKRRFETGDGDAATVTRNKDGYEFDVGGRKIDVHEIQAMHEVHPDDDVESIVILKDTSEVKVVKAGGPGVATIITGTALDEAAKEKLRKVLADSGVTGEVLFVDTGELAAGEGAKHHKVRIIKKEVD